MPVFNSLQEYFKVCKEYVLEWTDSRGVEYDKYIYCPKAKAPI